MSRISAAHFRALCHLHSTHASIHVCNGGNCRPFWSQTWYFCPLPLHTSRKTLPPPMAGVGAFPNCWGCPIPILWPLMSPSPRLQNGDEMALPPPLHMGVLEVADNTGRPACDVRLWAPLPPVQELKCFGLYGHTVIACRR